MYLSRLVLNARSHAVHKDLADAQGLHRTVMSAFPQWESRDARAAFGVLHRLDIDSRAGRLTLLVQSTERPDWGGLTDGYLLPVGADLPANPACKPLDEAYAGLGAGQVLAFRLRANPSKKLSNRERRNSQRVELRSEEEQIAWLEHKATECGFALVKESVDPPVSAVKVVPEDKSTGRRAQERLTVRPVLFEGLLQITDADRFRQALANGVGPGKAYGCGLLSVAAPRR